MQMGMVCVFRLTSCHLAAYLWCSVLGALRKHVDTASVATDARHALCMFALNHAALVRSSLGMGRSPVSAILLVLTGGLF